MQQPSYLSAQLSPGQSIDGLGDLQDLPDLTLIRIQSSPPHRRFPSEQDVGCVNYSSRDQRGLCR
ncbi:hypothetical protein MGG_17143 [Pyricularia oryzae 70-15]|uniref:Uncharacterized protein n=1 Tax=Pyricularia oryzae (strain 70-15 / ATCC MYA-4617 / FGSC 8958) TaxID=242507 RepID=G4N5Y1_PYRO7|nr:uncharacterized protein MGG_17143 [Pyricularia oryzae 70-15]EHA50557.1 hypothetical protein MGG_17143 [Pyricularia oryzae 70-15]